MEVPNDPTVVNNNEEADGDEDNIVSNIHEVTFANRKSKRQKVPTKSLLGEYECDRGFLKQARKAVSDAIYKGDNIDYSAKFSVLREMMKTPL